MPAPPYDAKQLARARLRSLERRAARAELKRLITAGDLTIRDLLERGKRGTPDKVAAHIEIADALLAVDGIGPATAATILNQWHVDPRLHLDMLNAEERDAISTAVDELTAPPA